MNNYETRCPVCGKVMKSEDEILYHKRKEKYGNIYGWYICCSNCGYDEREIKNTIDFVHTHFNVSHNVARQMCFNRMQEFIELTIREMIAIFTEYDYDIDKIALDDKMIKLVESKMHLSFMLQLSHME